MLESDDVLKTRSRAKQASGIVFIFHSVFFSVYDGKSDKSAKRVIKTETKSILTDFRNI